LFLRVRFEFKIQSYGRFVVRYMRMTPECSFPIGSSVPFQTRFISDFGIERIDCFTWRRFCLDAR